MLELTFNTETIAILIMTIIIAFAIGWYLASTRLQKNIQQLHNDKTHLQTSLEMEQQMAARAQQENEKKPSTSHCPTP